MSGLLRVLVAGGSFHQVSERLASDPRAAQAARTADAGEALAHAAAVVTERPLRPPAAAVFQREHPAARDRMGALPERAAREVQATRAGGEGAGGSRSADATLALAYAAAVMRQEEIVEDLAHAHADPAGYHAALPAGCRARVEELMLERSMRSGLTLTLDSLLRAWTKLVGHTERGDGRLSREEHENWLDARDVLADAIGLIEPPAREPLDAELRRLDERFLAATVPSDSSIAPRDPWRAQGWWWYRRPRTEPRRRTGCS